MAITVANGTSHAVAALKLPSNAFTGEEVRIANDVNSRIVDFHLWHWTLTAGTNIAVSSGTQDYTMASGDQNKVAQIANANLLEGSTQNPDLLVQSWPLLPKDATTGQPYVVGMVSPTVIRFLPTPDATYTFQWRYYARPTVLTANSNNYDCPDSFEHVILQGIIWKFMQFLDDERQETQYERFIKELSLLRQAEFRAVHRRRV